MPDNQSGSLRPRPSTTRLMRRRSSSSAPRAATAASRAEVSGRSTSVKVRRSSSREGPAAAPVVRCSNGLARRGSTTVRSELTSASSRSGCSSSITARTSRIRSGSGSAHPPVPLRTGSRYDSGRVPLGVTRPPLRCLPFFATPRILRALPGPAPAAASSGSAGRTCRRPGATICTPPGGLVNDGHRAQVHAPTRVSVLKQVAATPEAPQQ